MGIRLNPLYFRPMIASRKHGFIFIKTMKTAGTSIELALSTVCGPDDILTPIGVEHDRLRADAGIEPRNFSDTLEARYLKALRKRNNKLMRPVLRELEASGFWAHAFPDAIKARVGRKFWKSAVKIASERHPYEKALSRAYHSYRKTMPLADHLDQVVFEERLYVGHRHYIQDGKVIAGFFVRYNLLNEDFARLCNRLALPSLTLPMARYNAERDRTPAREVLSPRQRAFIYEQCAPEFELFGWER